MRKRAKEAGINVHEMLLLTVDQAAGLLNLGRDKTYKLAWEKEIPTVKIGNALRFPRVAVEAYVARLCREQGVEVEG